MNTGQEQGGDDTGDQLDPNKEMASEDDNTNSKTTSDASATNQEVDASTINESDTHRREPLAHPTAFVLAARGILELHGKGAKYKEFIRLMKDFHQARLTTSSLLCAVREVFEGYPILIYGFNCFLPKGYLIAPEKTTPVTVNEALNYASKVKERFGDGEKYRSFLDILRNYRCDEKKFNDIFIEILLMFGKNYDLIEGFGKFFPFLTTAKATILLAHLK